MTASLARFLIVVGLLVGALGGYWFWYSVVADESAYVAQLSGDIHTKTSIASRTGLVRATLDQLASGEAVVQRYFVSNTDIVPFLEDLQARGTAAGAAVKVLSVSGGTPGGHPSLQIALEVSGAFSSVMNTIGRIEYAPYDLSIASLALTQTSGTQTSKTPTPARWTADMIFLVGSASSTMPAARVSNSVGTTSATQSHATATTSPKTNGALQPL